MHADDRVPVAFERYPGIVKHSVLNTTPTAERPVLSDEQRALEVAICDLKARLRATAPASSASV